MWPIDHANYTRQRGICPTVGTSLNQQLKQLKRYRAWILRHDKNDYIDFIIFISLILNKHLKMTFTLFLSTRLAHWVTGDFTHGPFSCTAATAPWTVPSESRAHQVRLSRSAPSEVSLCLEFYYQECHWEIFIFTESIQTGGGGGVKERPEMEAPSHSTSQ